MSRCRHRKLHPELKASHATVQYCLSIPVAPTKPVDPVWPLPPVAPVAPVRPEAPVVPLEPVLPASKGSSCHHIHGFTSIRSHDLQIKHSCIQRRHHLRGSNLHEIAPVAPAKPVEPVWPLPPVNPVAPVKPEAPVAPLEPVDPLEPVEPVLPASKITLSHDFIGCEAFNLMILVCSTACV